MTPEQIDQRIKEIELRRIEIRKEQDELNKSQEELWEKIESLQEDGFSIRAKLKQAIFELSDLENEKASLENKLVE